MKKENLPLQINEYKKLFNIQDRPKTGRIKLDKDNLYEENIHLKTKHNELIKENSLLKIDNQKNKSDTKKKDKQIESFMQDYQNYLQNNAKGHSGAQSSEEMKMLDKAKSFNTINHLKKKNKELKLENEEKAKK